MITTTGSAGHGMNAGISGEIGSNTTFVNRGAITVSGSNAHGIRSIETSAGTQLTNSGTITATAPNGNGVLMNGGSVINEAGGSIRGGLAGVRFVGAFDNSLINSGNITGGSLGAIDMGDGQDSITILGGIITGSLNTGAGNDSLSWSGGNLSGLDMGTGDDVATFVNLTTANLTRGLSIDGGPGPDRLIWDHTAGDGVARYINWESFELTNFSELTFSSTLTLGDAGTGTGTLSIDPTSTVFAGNGAHSIVPFSTGQLVTVQNAGTIDLTNGPAAATDTLAIVGNYTGQNGKLLLQTVLGTDGSPSDRLVISNGTTSGQTAIGVTNLNGPGAATTSDGILLVEAVNGGTTVSGSFSLAGPVAAGAREYLLFRGGVTGGTTDNWYLRSAIIPPQEGVPPPELAAPSVGTTRPPMPGDPPPNPGATPVIPRPGESVPLCRPEVPTYTVIPPVLRLTTLATLGTFHERRGEQSLLTPGDNFSAAWGRVFGQSIEQRWSGTVDPSIDGSIWGGQVGLDVLRWESANDHQDTAGLFFGYSTINADVKGQALGWNNLAVGDVDEDVTSFGGYWTHVGPSDWYVDAVLMGSWFDGSAQSNRGIGVDTDGSGLTASIEGGYPIAVAENWVLEPQGQLIYQHLSIDDQNDGFATVKFDTDDGWTGRLGLRLQGNLQTSVGLVQPYVKANLWHSFDGTETIDFGSDVISTHFGGTSMELGGGVVVAISKDISLYATADYTFEVEGEKQQALEGNVGLRVQW